MHVLSQVLLVVTLLNMAAVIVLSFLWKNENVTWRTLFSAGSFAYRDLSKYIRPDRTRAFLALSYSAIILFMILLLSAIVLRP